MPKQSFTITELSDKWDASPEMIRRFLHETTARPKHSRYAVTCPIVKLGNLALWRLFHRWIPPQWLKSTKDANTISLDHLVSSELEVSQKSEGDNKRLSYLKRKLSGMTLREAESFLVGRILKIAERRLKSKNQPISIAAIASELEIGRTKVFVLRKLAGANPPDHA